jgi:hypothetical protein
VFLDETDHKAEGEYGYYRVACYCYFHNLAHDFAPAPWPEPPAGSLIARRRAAVRAAEAEAGTEVTIGPENLDALTAFADRSGLSAIADPEARQEASAQKADELAALFGY